MKISYDRNMQFIRLCRAHAHEILSSSDISNKGVKPTRREEKRMRILFLCISNSIDIRRTIEIDRIWALLEMEDCLSSCYHLLLNIFSE